ncbi:MAG: efflux RND transporter permease subunit [Flavobacteriaceae bacterium]
MLSKIIYFFIKNKAIALMLGLSILLMGFMFAPFKWADGFLYRAPVQVDAIPDLGVNQQIVSTPWKGHSPEDIDDQITYPLSSSLLGLTGVKTVRTSSMYGLSSVYVIFEDDVDYNTSRAKILERLSALPSGLLPEEVQPQLGPDATGLGQVYMYTIEGQDANGAYVPAWSLHELRSYQDYVIKPALTAVSGVAEVASVGGFVKEFQINLDPEKLSYYKLSIAQVAQAIKKNNQEVSAGALELNQVEYFLKAKGYLSSIKDMEHVLVGTHQNHPIYLADIAQIQLGPEKRRGILDDGGKEAVGGVVTIQNGQNPMEVIQSVKEKIKELQPFLQTKEYHSEQVKVKILPFYDRSELIESSLDTLEEALTMELLISIFVIVLMLRSFRSSTLIASLIPLAIALCFFGMYVFDIQANIVALAGIAIAIGTLVDMGIVLSENIYQKLQTTTNRLSTTEMDDLVYKASKEVAPALLTATLTTVLSFLPVFALQGAEGKMFSPLAWTKTLVLIASFIVAITLLPAAASFLFSKRSLWSKKLLNFLRIGVLLIAVILLALYWKPQGLDSGFLINFGFIAILLLLLLGLIYGVYLNYEKLLSLALKYKVAFLSIPLIMIGIAISFWGSIPREFMPKLQEGSFLLMPTSLPYSSVEVNKQYLKQLDQIVADIPEVDRVVGKAGRVNSALDPAPLSMFENIITYLPEYSKDSLGELQRNWRDEIKSTEDIWKQIQSKTQLAGLSSAPKLQPIETRLLMLQSGMKSPLGFKIKGLSLDQIESFGEELEAFLRTVDGVNHKSIYLERTASKPYLEIEIDKIKAARYGLNIAQVQEAFKIAADGLVIGEVVQGRERYGLSMKYPIGNKSSIQNLHQIEIPLPKGGEVSLGQVADIEFKKGPQMIKSEDGFLMSYLTFSSDLEVNDIELAQEIQEQLSLSLNKGEIEVPYGLSYELTGEFVQNAKANETLSLVIPLVLFLIFFILYLQFKSVGVSLMIFSGILTAFSGAFIFMGLYSSMDWIPGSQDFALSVAVWVGFIALFGIATDDGVLMATYLKQQFEDSKPSSVDEIRSKVLRAGLRRIRPCLMTTATTLIALLPILISEGTGSEILRPMAIPCFGGMLGSLISLFVVPVMYGMREEYRFKKQES